MNYREKIRKAIECPQLNNTRYGEWGALTLEQRKYIKRLLDELDSADNYLKRVYLENKQLKDNWNKLKEYCQDNSFMQNTREYGTLTVVDADELAIYMEELESGDSNE